MSKKKRNKMTNAPITTTTQTPPVGENLPLNKEEREHPEAFVQETQHTGESAPVIAPPPM